MQAYLSWGLPQEAAEFLAKLYFCIQVLDDVKDGQPIEEVDQAIYTLIVDMPTDPFLARFRSAIGPALAMAYYKWQAANAAEAARDAVEMDKAYTWRASFYDVVMLVVALCVSTERAHEIAPLVMKHYGETRADYLKEFQ